MVNYDRQRRKRLPTSEQLSWYWSCPACGKEFFKDTPQGLGLARENHFRKHRRQARHDC